MNNMNSFSQLAEFLGTNPWLSIISFVIAVMGVALAIVFYIKGKRAKLPYYAIRSANIVSDFGSWMKPLEMRYSSQLIENLTVTKMAFWNAGRDTIDHQDIARADPLTLHVKESYKILDAKILSEKTPANKFSITTSPDQSSLALEFDYIDKDEGAVIQLIHTGKSGEDIDFGGSIKGAGKPIRKLSEERQFRYRFNRPIKARRITSGTGRSSIRDKIDTLFFFIVMALIIFIPAFLIPVLGIFGFFTPFGTITKVMLAIPYFFVVFLVIILSRVPPKKLPKGFDIFEEEIFW